MVAVRDTGSRLIIETDGPRWLRNVGWVVLALGASGFALTTAAGALSVTSALSAVGCAIGWVICLSLTMATRLELGDEALTGRVPGLVRTKSLRLPRADIAGIVVNTAAYHSECCLVRLASGRSQILLWQYATRTGKQQVGEAAAALARRLGVEVTRE